MPKNCCGARTLGSPLDSKEINQSILKEMLPYGSASAGKEITCNVGDLGLIPGLGRSPGGGKAYLQFHGLYRSWAAKSQTGLRDFHFTSLHFTSKEMNSEYSLEGLMLKLKLQYFGHMMQGADSLEKTLMLGKIKGRRRRG